jgi:MFS family permease
VRSALRYVRETPELAVPLALMALVGTLGFNFQVILPLLARFSFDGGASAYAALLCAMGIGSVIGALVTGARGRTGPGLITAAALAFGLTALLAAAMPTLALEIPVLALLGAASVTFAASINSTLQLAVSPEMRGRVMALYSIVFLGSTPIGGPLAGWLSQAYDPRVALLLAASAGLAAAWAAHAISMRAARRAEGGNRTLTCALGRSPSVALDGEPDPKEAADEHPHPHPRRLHAGGQRPRDRRPEGSARRGGVIASATRLRLRGGGRPRR